MAGWSFRECPIPAEALEDFSCDLVGDRRVGYFAGIGIRQDA